ncbi:glycerophosphodiester phosphodiesterase family protein [Aeromicrobium sp. CF4.19]|uniref:glycerophosphodiester phosphodiesterase family protein n=1 Tax=Aeromicrobium sp. CF4.19 TaxID=3373082 RepID=UPI003EE714CE
MNAPVVIGHRGVPGHRLEHTRPSYELAIAQGADYIEPDVVASKDGVLVVRHENEIGHTTDVASRPEFADRRTTKLVDGVAFSGWFTEDFTLSELTSLRCRERLPQLREHNLALNDTEPIMTFDEVLTLARSADRTVGVYVETKHPTYFHDLDLDLDDLLVDSLERHGLNRPDADVPVIIQSYEMQNLRGLRPRTPLPLVQLMDRAGAPWDLVVAGDARTYADLESAEELAGIARYADGIGPSKSQVIGRDDEHRLTGPTGLVERAHAEGLFVHIWTMRDENNFLPLDFRQGHERAAHGGAESEYLAFLDAGVDGVFSDFTQTAVAARARWSASRAAPAGA